MAKCYYNGVLLPEMPSNAIAGGYKCQFIRKNTNSGYYDLVMSPQRWYYSDNAINPVYTKKNRWYRIEIATADEATAWTFKESTTSGFAISATAPILWSSHDVPNGSISATEMYIEGTEPIPEDEGEEKNYFYMIKTETLESFADEARRINGSTDLLTTEQMIEIFGEAKIPKLQDKTITENGIYQADNGYDGLGSVTVEVESGGSLEGLEGCFNIMFYDENNTPLCFHSIPESYFVYEPNYFTKKWVTSDGTPVYFPFTPSQNMDIFASNATHVRALYEHFGLVEEEYPYLALQVYDDGFSRLIFMKSRSGVNFYNYRWVEKNIPTNIIASWDTSNIVLYVLANWTKNDLGTESSSYKAVDRSDAYYFSNFDMSDSFTKSHLYRLDE